MNYNFKSLLWKGVKDCISKYFFVILVSFLLLIIAKHTSTSIQNILYNICGGLFALPIIFVCYDLYQIIVTRKQRKMATTQINDKVREIFTGFIFLTSKLRSDFDSAIATTDFLDLRSSTTDKIFEDISSTKHNGFFLFSYFDDFCQEINEILNSTLFLAYAPNEIISLMSEFSMGYQALLDEFKTISKDDFILISSSDNLTFEVSKETQSERTVYQINQNKNNKNHVLYLASYPIFDEKMLKGIYRISGTKAQALSQNIFTLYSIINRWEKACGSNLEAENVFIVTGRLAQDPYINFHARNNIAINILWP